MKIALLLFYVYYILSCLHVAYSTIKINNFSILRRILEHPQLKITPPLPVNEFKTYVLQGLAKSTRFPNNLM